MSISHKPITCQASNVIDILGDAGARFTLIPSRSKAPRYSGWQHHGKSHADALAHAQAGGNVGVLCGSYSGGLIVIDADKDAPELEAQFPILTATVKTFRADAPNRAKWILRIDGELPPSKKCHDSGLEILADVGSGGGSNAVVFGVHDKGATIQHTGTAIVTLTAADVAVIWKWRTGGDLLDAGAPTTKQRRQRAYTGAKAATPATAAGSVPDSHQVRQYNRTHRIADELQRLGYRRQNADRWIPPQSEHGTASCIVNVAANHCWHFSGKNPTGREGKATPADLACAHDFGGSVDAFLASLTTATTDGGAPGVDYDALRTFARRGDIEPFVRKNLAQLAEQAAAAADAAAAAYAEHPTEQAEAAALALRKRADKATARVTAKRWPEPTVRKLMTAIVDDFADASAKYPGLEAKHISSKGLAARANATRNTIKDTMPLVLGWFIVRESSGVKRAALYRLSRVALDVVQIEHVCHSTDQSCSVCTTSAPRAPLLTHYPHDAFRGHVTPLPDTPDNRRHVYETAHALRTGRNVKPRPGEKIADSIPDVRGDLVRTPTDDDSDKRRAQLAAGYIFRQERRFGATIASPGGRALLLLDRLHDAGGSATGAELAAALGWSRHEISRLVGRLIEAGCVTKPTRYTVQIAENWQFELDKRLPEMPTYGSKAILDAQLLDARESYQQQRLQESVDCPDPAQFERMRIRIAAILTTLDTIERLRAALTAWAITAFAEERHAPVLKRILTRYASQDARQAAELRNRAAQGRRRLASLGTWRSAACATLPQSGSCRPPGDGGVDGGFSRATIQAVTS